MARYPTTFSRVSSGYKDSKNTLAETGYDLGFFDSIGTNLTLSGTLAGAAYTGTTAAFTSTLSANGAATFQSTVTVRGQTTANSLLAQSGATFNSTVSIGGAVTQLSTVTTLGQTTATGGVAIGGGANVVALSTATAAVSLGAIAPLESSSVQTVALSGATRGDAIFITLDSIYPNAAANRDVTWMASSSSTAGEVHVWGVNSTLTSVTPTANTVIRLTRLNFASYL